MPRKAWQMEFVRLVVWLLTWAFLGWAANQFWLCLLAGVSFYLAGHLYSIHQLHSWLRSGEHKAMPEGRGIWEEIYRQFYQLERRHRRNKLHLKTIVNQFEASTAALPDAAVVLDSKERIVWFNEAAVTLMGLCSPKDLGQRIVNLMRQPELHQYLAQENYDGNIELSQLPNSNISLSVRVIPYGNNQRLLLARDISHQKLLEATRRDFVANASHEMRTPLTVLRGYLDMMNEESVEGELVPWQTPLKDMIVQTSRMEAIITDLLKLAKLESRPEHHHQDIVDVPTMLEEIADEANTLSNGEHRIHLQTERGLHLWGQASSLHSIFSNLIFNAVRYTPGSGDIRIYWGRQDARDKGVLFSVADSGIGIEKRHIPRLTERFYRADPSRSANTGGTGLGLAIVKHALEHHEAELSIESQPGHGSVFTCHFPAQRIRQAESIQTTEKNIEKAVQIS